MRHATLKKTGAGNASQLILELDRSVDEAALRAALAEFARCFPPLCGGVARAKNREPYWEIPPNCTPQIRFEISPVSPENLPSVLEKNINAPFLNDRENVAFSLLNLPDGTARLVMKFDHRLFDARGADFFLLLFSRFVSGEVSAQNIREQLAESARRVPPNWKERLICGKHMSCVFRRNVVGAKMVRMPAARKNEKRPGRFFLYELDAEQSKAYIDCAYRDAGYLMFMPYALATACSIYSAVCKTDRHDGSFVVPSTMDMRGPEVDVRNMFFNYCSMFFFKITQAEEKNRADLLATVKQQFFTQTKELFPQHVESFMAVMRFLPIQLFSTIINSNHASFSFGSVGCSLLSGKQLFGAEIKNLTHMPLIPPNVSTGFFVNQFCERINIGVSFREGVLNEADRAAAAEVIKAYCK